jgi:hypothetical protein
VFVLAEAEGAKTREERANELLRSGRLVFLETAGYTAAKITGLGDLAALPLETMSTLLHRKAEEAVAKALGEPPKIRKLTRRKRRKVTNHA